MGNSTSLSKSRFSARQIFLAGVVCSLIVLELVNVLTHTGNAFAYNPRHADWLSVLGSLLVIPVLLKFSLPDWQPHKTWLGWLLGFAFAASSLSEFYSFSLPDILFTLARILLNPFFPLLIGVACKKSTEKIAGVFAAISLAGLAITTFLIFTNPERVVGVPSVYLMRLFAYTVYTILFFTWPVLTRPILEKESPSMKIAFEKNLNPKQKPDQSALGFGKYFTDHMFLMNYDEGQGWHGPRIVPYGPIALEPAAMCLHYGQEVFEGMKAYHGADGKIRLFRPQENMARLNLSNERLCIPLIDEALAVRAIEELVKTDRDWIPTQDGTSLYIRPFIFAVDPFVGVRPASQYIFAVILSPVGAYYPEGLNPVNIHVEQNYVRAIRGGTGFAKAGGNYAGSLKAQGEAQARGFTQVMWLDGIERRYIEEVGTMNVFFQLGDEIVTPALSGSILGGITRKSCIAILRGWGYTVTERPLALEEVVAAAKSGSLLEAFGTGTAAVVSPIGSLCCGGETLTINNGATGVLTQRLYDELTGIQWGKLADTRGWTKIIA